MSIETTLTWAVALGILFAALVMRTIAFVVYRLALFVWVRLGGTAPVRREADVRDALPAIPLRERLAAVGEGAGAVLIFVAATIARWIELVGRGLGWLLDRSAHGSVAAWRWTAPRAGAAARATGRGLQAAWVWTAAAIATFVRDARSTSYPGAARRSPAVGVGTYATSRAHAASVARARSSAGTRAGAA